MELIFYTNPNSRGRIARWMLEETCQPYQTEILDYAQMKAPDYLATNPMGKVPTIRHGAMVVTETAAICAYLADAFPETNLAPPVSSPLRGPYYRWLFFAAAPLEAAITNRVCGFELKEGQSRMAGYGSFQDTMDTLEYAVGQSPYLLGEAFSAADLYVGAQIGFGLRFGTIEKRPAFQAYWERLAQRPVYIKATAIDDALVQKPKL